jgi:hypothetical protein
MRGKGCVIALFVLAACSSGGGSSATLVLKNRYWDRVNVEAVITTREGCNSRAKGYVKTEHFVMQKDDTREIIAPHDETICWRHDRNPNHPSLGDWSEWFKAILYPGQKHEEPL